MKNVVIVAAHFPPSNLAAVHRARLWAQHLHEFGWRPIIVATHHSFYEETLDWGLASLVPPDVEVVRTRAFPVRPIRFVGDIGVRSLPWHYSAIKRLSVQGRADFVHVTIPSNYSAMLGPLVHRRLKIPYGIDYIDPWVAKWPGTDVMGSKAWASYELSRVLEPFAVRNAALISGIDQGYFSDMLDRNPTVRAKAVLVSMPYGFSERDFDAVRGAAGTSFPFARPNGEVHLVYAGAMLPNGYAVLEAFLAGVRELVRRDCAKANRLRVHFIGTGKAPDDPEGYNVLPYAERAGVRGMVTETPNRIGYMDVLGRLAGADGILVIGSVESHYSPSKVYQAVQARRPVLALLHEASSAVGVLRNSGAGEALTLTPDRLPDPGSVADALERLYFSRPFDPAVVNWTAFGQFSARESSRRLAASLDEAFERAGRSH